MTHQHHNPIIDLRGPCVPDRAQATPSEPPASNQLSAPKASSVTREPRDVDVRVFCTDFREELNDEAGPAVALLCAEQYLYRALGSPNSLVPERDQEIHSAGQVSGFWVNEIFRVAATHLVYEMWSLDPLLDECDEMALLVMLRWMVPHSEDGIYFAEVIWLTEAILRQRPMPLAAPDLDEFESVCQFFSGYEVVVALVKLVHSRRGEGTVLDEVDAALARARDACLEHTVARALGSRDVVTLLPSVFERGRATSNVTVLPVRGN